MIYRKNGARRIKPCLPLAQVWLATKKQTRVGFFFSATGVHFFLEKELRAFALQATLYQRIQVFTQHLTLHK